MGSFGSWASIAMVVALAISGCSSTEEGASSSILNLPTGPTNDPLLKTGESPRDLARRTQGNIRDLIPALRGSADSAAAALPVNRYIWRASLDTLRTVLPIASVDVASGIVATDWGSVNPAVTNERVRATALVSSQELVASSLDVTVFREVLGASGVWQPAPVEPTTAVQLEDAILTRARELRIIDVDAGRI